MPLDLDRVDIILIIRLVVVFLRQNEAVVPSREWKRKLSQALNTRLKQQIVKVFWDLFAYCWEVPPTLYIGHEIPGTQLIRAEDPEEVAPLPVKRDHCQG